MIEKHRIHISELSSTVHSFYKYHFCRGNTSKRKSRFGIIERGEGVYMYLNKRLAVKEGDVVFIPEGIFCYSEWRGNPDIQVTYINCFMHYQAGFYEYEPQKLPNPTGIRQELLRICSLLNGDLADELEAYSLFYGILKTVIPNMQQRQISADKALQQAIAYIMEHWDQDFSVKDLAVQCGMSESKIYHGFQAQLGQTPVHFLNSIRINHAIKFLESTDEPISMISQRVGFHSENHFRKKFVEITGTTPLKFRKRS